MGIEIEHKFLVISEDWRKFIKEELIISQGYLANNETCSVRLRITGEQAHLNIKSATLGISRQEYDYPVPLEDGQLMMQQLCQKPLIEKTRYHVPYKNHLWEVDVFHGDNEGLIVAEIELSTPDEPFSKPAWIGKDVSDHPRYYNVCLVTHPFNQWNETEKKGERR